MSNWVTKKLKELGQMRGAGADKLTQPGDVALKGGGQKIEQLFYSTLATETARRALKIYSDPSAQP